MRPIDADRLMDALYDNEFQTLCPLDEVEGVIDAAPTLDVQPVRRGEWHVCQDVNGNEYGKCSYCGGETYDGDNDTFDQPPDFCQHCGADMRRTGNE